MGKIKVDYGAMGTGASQLQNAGTTLQGILDMATANRSMLQEYWQSTGADSFDGAFERLRVATVQVQEALGQLGTHVSNTNAGFQTADADVAGAFNRFGH